MKNKMRLAAVFFGFVLCLGVTRITLAAEQEWEVPTARISVQNAGFFQYWAGEPTECLRNADKTDVIRCRVRITHITDKTDYSCGQIIDLPIEEFVELKGVSMALSKCN